MILFVFYLILCFSKLNFIYFLTILGGSLKKIAKNITIKVPISKKVYTNASIFKLYLSLLKIYTIPCFFVDLSPSFWNAPNSTCSKTSAPIPANTSLNNVRPPCHR